MSRHRFPAPLLGRRHTAGMREGFYQDDLARETDVVPPRGGTAPPGPEDVPGRRAAVFLHLALPLGGPVGLVIHTVVALLVGRDRRPLVAHTADAVLRFAVQVVLLFGLALLLDHLGVDGLARATMTIAIVAWFTVPLLAAVQTWRTGRVFRYPLWDLLRDRR